MAVSDYSTNPALNTLISGINIGEGCNASVINDAMRQLMADIAGILVNGQLSPAGSIHAYAGASIPTGFLACDGSAVSRSTYPALFTALGTTWGAGDGSTTFNVPDFRGRVVVGDGAGSGLTARVGAGSGGVEAHVLSVGEAPALTATLSGTTAAAGGHTHTVTDPGHAHGYAAGYSGGGFTGPVTGGGSQQTTCNTNSATTGISIAAVADHTHALSGTASTNGGGGAHNNMQPFAVAKVIIKT